MNAVDKDILRLIDSGKIDQGFDILMNEYRKQLYWHIRRMVTFHEDADDVLQNTFIKIYQNIHKFKADSKLYTWMYRIATNESLNHLRKQKKQTNESDGLVELEQRLKADVYFDEQAAYVALQKAISLLPDKQKAVFNMRYFDELSYKEMAEILETSVGSLKASYHHAVKKVENYLSNQSVDVG